MLEQFKTVFVLAPHTDDGELGAGGTIARLVETGADVHYFAFSTAEASVPEHLPKGILKTEVKAATSKLGIQPEKLHIYNYEVRKLGYHRQEILEDLIAIRRKVKPNLVFIPSLNDIHQDHMVVAQEGLRAFKATTVLGYELIWNNLNFNTACFVELEQRHLGAKIKALSEYKSQSHRDYMSEEFVTSLMRSRGVQIGCKFAESFEVIRWVI